MKKAVIYYFTGTGNTRLVAELYKKYLKDYETTLFQIRMENKQYVEFPMPHDFDLVGLAFPVHGFNAPKVMNDFTKLLPKVENKKTFMFKTSGEGLHYNMYSGQKIIRRLQKKGYDFLTDRHYVMPYNMIFRHSPEMVKSEYIYADAYVRLNCRQLESDYHEKVLINPLKMWFVPIVRIEWIYAQVQGPAMKVDMKKCVKCMKCVKNCPLSNIKFTDGKFKFGANCSLCVCCSFGCPSEAISIGLLNGWRVNGSYQIEKTAKDESIEFPAFTEKLSGIKKWLYYKYYKNVEKQLEENNIEINSN